MNKIIRNLLRISKVKKALLGLFLISAIIPLLSDIAYGTKAKAEEHMFGIFLLNFSNFTFTLFSIIILVLLALHFIMKKIIQHIPSYIEEENPEKKK